MSLEAALKAFIAEVVREVTEAAPAGKRGPGRPPKGAEGAPATPPAAQAGTVSPPAATAALPATPAASAAAALTHAAVAPSFLAAAKTHGRDFVIAVMKELGVPGDPPTFDKVPIASLVAAKALLETGPKAKPAATDGTDLLG